MFVCWIAERESDKMAARIYRTAVIGLGRIAWSRHLPELLRKKDKYELSAIVDPIAARCDETRAKFGPVKSFSSVEELLRNDAPDLAVVCSPTIFHKDQCIALLDRGVHVFCDKPAALNLEEAEAMFEAARRNARRLMIFQPKRVQPESEAAAEIIRSGKLGKIYQISYFSSSYVRRSDWQAQRRNGGGMLLNYGAHYIDLMLYLTGERLIPEYCRTGLVATLGDAEDVVKVILRGPDSGVLCEVDISQASLWRPCEMMIRGSLGTAWYPFEADAWKLRYYEPGMFPERKLSEQLAAEQRKYNLDQVEPLAEEVPVIPGDRSGVYYDNFYAWLEGKAEPVVGEQDTLLLMETLEKCRKLSENGGHAG